MYVVLVSVSKTIEWKCKRYGFSLYNFLMSIRLCGNLFRLVNKCSNWEPSLTIINAPEYDVFDFLFLSPFIGSNRFVSFQASLRVDTIVRLFLIFESAHCYSFSILAQRSECGWGCGRKAGKVLIFHALHLSSPAHVCQVSVKATYTQQGGKSFIDF